MGQFGIDHTCRSSRPGSPAAIATLRMQANALIKTSTARLEQVAALRLVTAATAQARHALIDCMRNVFGQNFVTLPRFTCDAAGAAELSRR
jgi:hypothetical protein